MSKATASATSRSAGPSARRPAASRRSKPQRQGSALRRLLRRLFLAFVAMVTVFSAIAVGIFLGYINSLPPLEDFENYNPEQISHIYDRSGTEPIGDFKRLNRQMVRIEEIPKRLSNAFLAIEDARFYEHFGVDPVGLMAVLFESLKAGHLTRGASTISQQTARNVLDKEIGNARTLSRKLREMMATIQIERRYSKDQILEIYLNEIAFSYNSFGVKAAAATYFSKSLNDLTIAECATLAAIPKAPSKYNPLRDPVRAKLRRDVVLDRMYELRMITKEEWTQAKAEPIKVNRGRSNVTRYPYFTDALERDLNGYYGVTDKQLLEGGLRIVSTVDAKIQEACEHALQEGLVRVERQWQEAKPGRMSLEYRDHGSGLKAGDVRLMRIAKVDDGAHTLDVTFEGYRGTIELPEVLPFYEPDKCVKRGELIDIRVDSIKGGRITGKLGHDTPVLGSMVCLDAHSGEVLALVGGVNFYDENWRGKYNRAIQGGRQPGSCFKPFFYASAFEKGIPPNSVIIDEPILYGGKYRPKNYERDGNQPIYFGPTTLIQALEHSRNVVTLRLFEVLGLRTGLNMVRRFDFTGERAKWDIPAEVAVALGTSNCAPMELAAAYQSFANLGVGIRPQFFRTISDPHGRIEVPRKDREEQIISPIAAYQTQYLLRQVVLGGSGKATIGSRFPSPPNPPIAGKTGTTNDCRDAWFSGFTPDIVLVVQVGFDTPRSMGPKMTGSRVAGPIWGDAFEQILKTRRTWRMTFDSPGDGVEFADICAATGKRASDVCGAENHLVYPLVPFARGQAPQAACDGGIIAPLIAPVGDEYAWAQGLAAYRGFATRAWGGESGSDSSASADQATNDAAENDAAGETDEAPAVGVNDGAL